MKTVELKIAVLINLRFFIDGGFTYSLIIKTFVTIQFPS